MNVRSALSRCGAVEPRIQKLESGGILLCRRLWIDGSPSAHRNDRYAICDGSLISGIGRGWGRLREGHAISLSLPASSSILQRRGTAPASDESCDTDGPDRQEPRSLVAGIGFRHGAGADEIIALIRRALAESAQAADRLATIATAEDRAGERPIREAAAAFDLVPTGISPSALIAVDRHVATRSGRIEASRSVGSVAEAAALAAAGDGGILILPRIASPAVTCALALPVHFSTQAP